MSFVTQDDIMHLIEALLQHCWPPHLEHLSLPLPRMSYADAIRRYGSDKPDTRYGNLVLLFIIFILFIDVLPRLTQPGHPSMSAGDSWGVNRHTVRCVFVVLQCKLVSG